MTIPRATKPLTNRNNLIVNSLAHIAADLRNPLPFDLSHGVSRSVRTPPEEIMLYGKCREGDEIKNPHGNTSRRFF